MNTNDRLEHNAKWLGYLGILPFLSAPLLLTDWYHQQILFSIQTYGAIILTFVGAVHWGRALDNNESNLMLISVIPSLLAWLSLLLPAVYGLPVLIISFLCMIVFDYQQYKSISWFQQLRLRLSIIVCSLLGVSWLLS